MNSPSDWSDAVWQDIKDSVLTELGNVRVCQKVFPTIPPSEPPGGEVPNEVVNFEDLSIEEGQTKPFVELRVPFALSYAQMMTAPETGIAKTLAKMAAKIAGLAEDGVILRGGATVLPANVEVDRIASAGKGLLGEAEREDADDGDPNKVSEPVDVPLVTDRPGRLYAENTFSAVTKGISKLVAKGQAPAYALLVPPEVYADAFVPEGGNLGTFGDAIQALVEGGFYSVSTMPKDRGLLVALAGDPTKLYEGIEPSTAYVRQEGSKYFLQLTLRAQFVALDPRALVLLRFAQPENYRSGRSAARK